MNTKTTIISMALWMISLTTAWAQTTIVSKGKAKGRIVCTEKTATNTELPVPRLRKLCSSS